MKRKEFINISSKTLLGLIFANSFLVSCFSTEQDISNIIGKNINNFKDLKTEYNGKISCYSITNFKFHVKGEKAFIFCINKVIVGISIKIKNNKPLTDIVDITNSKKTIYNNAFGSKTLWKEKNIFKSISTPKDYQNIENYIFYGEYLEEGSSIVW